MLANGYNWEEFLFQCINLLYLKNVQTLNITSVHLHGHGVNDCTGVHGATSSIQGGKFFESANYLSQRIIWVGQLSELANYSIW